MDESTLYFGLFRADLPCIWIFFNPIMCASTLYEKNDRQIHGRFTLDISHIQGRSTLDIIISHIQGRSAQLLIQGRWVGASTLYHLRYRVDAPISSQIARIYPVYPDMGVIYPTYPALHAFYTCKGCGTTLYISSNTG